MNMSTRAVDISGVHKVFGRVQALADVSWGAASGEWWGVVGPNGSGKSTLLRLLSGVDGPDDGSVRILGQEAAAYKRKELSRIVAVLQQDGVPPVGYTVRDVVEMGRYPHLDWAGRDTAEDIVDRVLDQLGLALLAERRLDQLSGGQRQRVALAKVMAQNPQILLLDEPTTYLDLHYQLQFMELLAEWRRKAGITIIAVLHDLNLAAQFCDRLLVLKEGRIEGAGTPGDLLTENNIHRWFGVDSHVMPHPDSAVPQLMLKRRE
ncbi:ABC transporter ATP-binding protein [Paenibacillus sp. P96]|uniref:ABC transporter ATP-binding protein n=1 Tax=Paenibacillus zeirhizosphaerae TaxID=2987519 RepID=A0ABT9FKS1_9BACL|nr:ABC transporter ATP-binding protein [Paenibacillus sp. P96]MDP4095310.1 ABC transporter ATP-binding protein [Paenibacillus sp. P96]